MVELVCHPDTPSHAVTGIAVHATRTTEEKLALHYCISGQIAGLRVPPPGPARIGWKLWRHTCCELFVREKNRAAYHEINLSPSGEWTIYAFSKYREGVALADESANPQIAIQSGPGRLDLYALADLPRLSQGYRNAPLAIGLAAVMEEEGGAISYWALRHAPGKPDFHHASAFALELDEVRH
ncbi:MAG TPA: DOMON-like domain-containing protein [Burkholderiales bacterium]|nr:DOMON-like domain-containing protein [Burkholderiales bacterium]